MELITLKNNVRIALNKNEFVRSCAVNLYIGYGSGDEEEKTSGAAHFIEHMLFKGTDKVNNEQISAITDRLGGHFNAFTAKEYTCIFGSFVSTDLKEGLSLILEMACNPKMSKSDTDTERGVILEEINMYEDSPEDVAADLISGVIYKNSGLKNKILGSRENIKAFTNTSLKEIHSKYYCPERMVLSVCGNFDKELVLELAEEYLGTLKNTGFLIKSGNGEFNRGIVLKERDFEQTQIILASNGAAVNSPFRFSGAVFSAIAGGNASSRLNMQIREKLGLAYSIYSCNVSYRNMGAFMVVAGTSHKNHLKVIDESRKIMDSIKSTITKTELDRVKSQFKASSVLGAESIAAIASAMGREILYSGKYTTIDEVINKIDKLTLDDIIYAAENLWDSNNLSLAVVGAPKSAERYNIM